MPLISAFAAASQTALGILFAVAVVPKLWRPGAFARSVRDYQIVPLRAVPAAAVLLIAAEAFLAVTLLTGLLSRPALPILVGLVLLMSLAVGVNLLRRRSVPCGCFGNASERISIRSLARLLVMLATAAFLFVVEDLAGVSVWTPTAMPIGLAMAGQLVQTVLLAGFLLVVSMWILFLTDIIRLVAPRRS